MEEMHIIVSGLVQGVGFRAAVKRLAISHAIHGYVRNLPDGRVEICAQGSLQQLVSFLASLRENPGAGRIDRFDASTRNAAEAFTSFEVR